MYMQLSTQTINKIRTFYTPLNIYIEPVFPNTLHEDCEMVGHCLICKIIWLTKDLFSHFEKEYALLTRYTYTESIHLPHYWFVR